MKKYTIDEVAKQINMFDERWYEIKGPEGPIYVPSVTTYLESWPKGFGFEMWLKTTKDPDAIKLEAGQLGSQVHDLIHRTLIGETIKYCEQVMTVEVWERYLSWCTWWREFNSKHEVKLNKKLVEVMLWDAALRVAGTCDLIATVDGDPVVFDWKTGKTVGVTAEIQVSVYAYLAHKMFKLPVKYANIVQTNPKVRNRKGYKEVIIPVSGIKDNLADFMHVKRIWERENKNAAPKFKTYPTEVSLEWLKKNEVIAHV